MDALTAKKLAKAARLIAEVQKDNPQLGGIQVYRDTNGKVSVFNVRQDDVDGLPPGEVVYSPDGLTEHYPMKASVDFENVEFYLYMRDRNCWPAYLNFNA